MTNVSDIRVGLLGCGHVGRALVGLLAENGDRVEARSGLRLEVARVAVQDPGKDRSVDLSPEVFTSDAEAVVTDPSIDVVVEVIGGIEPARRLILAALEAKKPVVSANKELLAEFGPELFAAAARSGVDLLFEAAVAGGIPIIRPLRESLAGDRLRRIMGIVNGTTNFILTRMAEDGQTFEDALAEAQALGYAERDPTADIEGFDAASKAAILATVAFGAHVASADVYREGITGITREDIGMAHRLGYAIKLLAIVEAYEASGELAVRVHPAMVPLDHPLAAVRDSFNAVFVEGEAAGELMFYGRGAGGRPTASAVLGDLIDAAANLRQGRVTGQVGLAPTRVRPIEELRSQYYVSIDVVDRPGVAEQLFGVTARHGVSIWKMEQLGLGDEARLVLVTHTTTERDMQATLEGFRQSEVVDRVGTLLRVIGPE